MKKIVVIGPESTGKSTLCKTLADHYQTVWCPEYARTYLLQHGRQYTYDDLSAIARGQLALEKTTEAKATNGLYFIDTCLYVMKVWHEVAFGACPTWILKELSTTRYDLYLLCNTDLPWQKDELREYPDLKTRERLFSMYQDVLSNQTTPWVEISGTDTTRLEIAKNAVNAIMKSK